MLNRILCLQDLKKCLKEEAKNINHKKYDSFILTVLSHGNKGIIYGRDGIRGSPPQNCVNIQKDILEVFDGNGSPDLHGKPKIFIIQACQGSK